VGLCASTAKTHIDSGSRWLDAVHLHHVNTHQISSLKGGIDNAIDKGSRRSPRGETHQIRSTDMCLQGVGTQCITHKLSRNTVASRMGSNASINLGTSSWQHSASKNWICSRMGIRKGCWRLLKEKHGEQMSHESHSSNKLSRYITTRQA
jgi:hypothetical protein